MPRRRRSIGLQLGSLFLHGGRRIARICQTLLRRLHVRQGRRTNGIPGFDGLPGGQGRLRGFGLCPGVYRHLVVGIHQRLGGHGQGVGLLLQGAGVFLPCHLVNLFIHVSGGALQHSRVGGVKGRGGGVRILHILRFALHVPLLPFKGIPHVLVGLHVVVVVVYLFL